MYVVLSSAGNPDYGQDPNRPLFGCESNKKLPVQSYKEASEVCRKFIDDNELGSGNWDGGQIFDHTQKKQIAHVSYNGRVWKGKEWTSTTEEIKI